MMLQNISMNSNASSVAGVSPGPSRPSSESGNSQTDSSSFGRGRDSLMSTPSPSPSRTPKKEEVIEKKYTRELSYYENGFSRLGLVMISLSIPLSRKSGDVDLGLTLDGTNVVVEVDCDGLAERYGIYPSLKIHKIIDSNKKERRIQPGRVTINGPTTIRLTENSGQPQTGRVLPNRRYIIPDRPIIVPPKFRSEDEQSPGVYGGAVRIRRDANSLGVRSGQVVKFSVRFDGNEFEAHLLKKEHKKESFGFRKTSEALLRSDSFEDTHPLPIPAADRNRKICLCGVYDGSCQNVNNAVYGEHPEEKFLAHEDTSKLVPIPAPKPIKMIKAANHYQIRFNNTNNLGETASIVIQPSGVHLLRPIQISPAKVMKVPNFKAMTYERNGVSRPDFKEIWYDGGRTIWLTDIDKKLTVPETENVPLIISRIRDLADYCGVKHNIKSLCNPTYSEAAGEKGMFTEVSPSELSSLANRWGKTVMRAWSIKNLHLEYLYNITKHNMTVGSKTGERLFEVNGLHGTAEKNIIAIATEGFDTSRRAGQAYGAGEYFANTIGVPSSYTKGGSFVFICDVLVKDKSPTYNTPSVTCDHSFVPEYGYIIVKNKEGSVQALPRYVVQVRKASTLASDFHLRRVLSQGDDDELLQGDPKAKGSKNTTPPSLDILLQHNEKEPVNSIISVSESGSEDSPDEYLERFSASLPSASDAGMFSPTTASLHVSGVTSISEVAEVTDLIKSKTGRDILSLRFVDGVDGKYSDLFVKTSSPISLLNFASLNYYGRLGLRSKTIVRFDDAEHGNDWSSWRVCRKGDCHGRSLLGVGGCCRVHEVAPVASRETDRYQFQHLDTKSASYYDIVGRLRTATTIISCTAIHSKKHPDLTVRPTGEWKDLWYYGGTTFDDAADIVKGGFHFGSDRLASDECPISKGQRSAICPNDCSHCTVVSTSLPLGIQFSDSCKLISPAKTRGDKAAFIKCRVRLPKKLISDSRHEWHRPAIRRSPNPLLGKKSHLYVVNRVTDIVPLHIVVISALVTRA